MTATEERPHGLRNLGIETGVNLFSGDAQRVYDTMAIDVKYKRRYDHRLFEFGKKGSRIFLNMEEWHDS